MCVDHCEESVSKERIGVHGFRASMYGWCLASHPFPPPPPNIYFLGGRD